MNTSQARFISRRNLWAVTVLAALLAAPLMWSSIPAIAKKPGLGQLRTAQSIIVHARQINSFLKINPLLSQFGKLTFLGGLVLTSPQKQFGGWSDITIDPDGKRLLAVSDMGVWMTASIGYEGTKPIKLANVRMGPLRALSGRLLKGKKERDAEGVELVSGTIDNGTLLVSFERIHRIGQFKSNRSGVIGPSKYIKLPKKVRKLSKNKGLESVTIIRGGRLKGAIITFAERHRKDDERDRPGWIVHRGERLDIELEDIDGYDITALAGLPNGDLLVLERRFRKKEWYKGIRIRLRLIKADDLQDGETVSGEILLSANSTSAIDNMEGLAVHQGAQGKTVITLISDDNFNKILQSTVFLQFSLPTNNSRSGVNQ